MGKVYDITVGVKEAATHMVRGYALTWPLPPGPAFNAKVTVDTEEYSCPFEKEISEGTQVFKASWLEQTLEETVIVDKDLVILFLFDPAEIFSEVIVA